MPGASFEKSVKGATKTKNAAPKSKYIEHILTATYSEAGVAEIFRTLQYRIRDSTWTIVYKALIVVHMMIREGSAGAALKYLAQHPRLLIVTSISEVQAQGLNIWRYSEYLISRANAFAETKTDFVRGGEGRLKRLTVSKGLLRETEIVQKQIHALVKCDLLMDEPDNEISLTAFRLLTLDLLTLYSVMNEGTINILENYFEMSRPDTERALKIYKRFSAQTEDVVKFLRIARQFESATRLAIPNLKHASTDLAKLLEDDLNDPDFDLRRREYRAQKFGTSSEEKEKGVARSRSVSAPQKSKPAPVSAQTAPPKLEVKSSGPNLIDFFDSTDQPQQKQLSMLQQTPQQQQFNPLTLQFQQPQQMQPQQFQQTGFQLQQTGFSPQNNFQQPQQFMQQMTGLGQQQQQTGFGGQFGQSNSNPFGQMQQLPPTQPQQQLQPLQPTHTGAGFGGYTPQPQWNTFQTALPSIPQNGMASFQQPTLTGGGRANNPFRQSILPPASSDTSNFSPLSPASSNPTPSSTNPATTLTRQSTNPFAKRLTVQTPQFTNGYQSQSSSPFTSQPPTAPLPELPSQEQQNQQPAAPTLQPQRTGKNPFARPQTAPGLRPQPQTQPQMPGQTLAPLRPNPTGSTNPFRQSVFINQHTGQGWQMGQQGTMGGLENLETRPVFPRPGQQIA
ncbi:ENTH domain-containing protein, variant [Blastomyces dermatitidis ER-3]|uniref:ENTH domain-containing protein n=1 Tax=Ajellomyces dermatitidis (strain ER-3 / ATCC MYA-2586) TaxID=559297 RepID=A0ABX2VZ14_AJEDR|nr:ENTH domain-containing protein [Blastomyces dermatitidis ER-3]XP_045282108.1 ENTH domain-containing protein, variant [Blastomyces dermatitidis ER-3]OAT02380.1 ENTH domain-containing protein [Blastomyces dermatitidis ER-3]OAT02381.1 ENTH domain-containing protein, variant [Blastomyces dermatitidis ER-3]